MTEMKLLVPCGPREQSRLLRAAEAQLSASSLGGNGRNGAACIGLNCNEAPTDGVRRLKGRIGHGQDGGEGDCGCVRYMDGDDEC